MLISIFFIYLAMMIFCGVSIIESDTFLSQASFFLGAIVFGVLAFSVITQIKEQE